MRVKHIKVEKSQEERRLDNFLLSRLKGVPKSHIYAIIRSGQVRINGKRSGASSRINDGDLVRVPPIRTAHREHTPPKDELVEQIKQSYIYEDENIIAINKPRWVGAHGGVNRPYGIIEVLHHILDSRDIYLVHRLDLETTGVLIIARNLDTLRKINNVWHDEGESRKIYAAVVVGLWKDGKEEKTRSVTRLFKDKVGGEYIMRPINPDHENQPTTEEQIKSKEAVTLFNLIKHQDDYSLMEAEILTGRTHQIRLQAATEGHPIAGDKKYAFLATDTRQTGDLALHCLRIEFTIDEKRYEFVAPTPPIFDQYGFQLPAKE